MRALQTMRLVLDATSREQPRYEMLIVPTTCRKSGSTDVNTAGRRRGADRNDHSPRRDVSFGRALSHFNQDSFRKSRFSTVSWAWDRIANDISATGVRGAGPRTGRRRSPPSAREPCCGFCARSRPNGFRDTLFRQRVCTWDARTLDAGASQQAPFRRARGSRRTRRRASSHWRRQVSCWMRKLGQAAGTYS